MVIAAYGIVLLLSFLLPVGYFLFVRKKQKEPWLLLLYICVCVVNLGYLLLSVSASVEFALLANKIAYLGQVFAPMCMLLLLSKVCNISYPKWVPYVLGVAAVLMLALVLTTGHLDWYYASVGLIKEDGASKLVKEYGVLHPLNLVYVLVYFVIMLTVVIVSLSKKSAVSHKPAGLMLAVVIGNVGMWVVEKLVPLNFEFLSVSYLMSSFVFFFVYWMLQDYIHVTDVAKAPEPQQAAVVEITSMSAEQKLEIILGQLKDGEALAMREREILELMLKNKKRKEIAAELFLSENTVKTYTRTLYAKLGVSSRDELYALLLRK